VAAGAATPVTAGLLIASTAAPAAAAAT